MAGTGAVRFEVTCSSAEGRRFFEQGVGQLHGFWYLEAERSFRQVAAIEPACAMAYWGMAMANLTNAKRAKGFAAEAVKRRTEGARVTAKEGRWIDAIGLLYAAEPKGEGARKRNFLAALKGMMAEFPEDVEVKAFWVRYAWEFRDVAETKLTDYAAADRVLDEVFKAAPDHPAHHYRIHLWDDKDAKRSIGAAAKLGPAAPGVAHMWHMPGHTYSKLKRYADAAWQQEAAARVDHAYMIRDRVMPYEIHNYAHNNEWLVRDLAYVGRVRDAIELATNMIELPRHPKFNAATNRGSGAEYGRARLVDVLAQHEMWDEYVAACAPGGPLAEDGDAEQRARKVRYLGVACAALGRAEEARGHVATLRVLRATAAAEATSRPTTRGSARLATTKPATAPANARVGRRGGGPNDRGVQIDRAIAHVEGALALAGGDAKKAVELLAKAEVRKEHLSQAYLRAGDKAKAEELAKKAVDENEGQAYPLANYAAVLHASGKPAGAKGALEKLRGVADGLDAGVGAYARLGPIAAEVGLGTKWLKGARVVAKDVGARPALDSLGPFRWRPAEAPQWSAPAAGGGAPVSLSAYRGRPVIVLFYLGHGCLHCAEQLAAFAPAAKELAADGVSVVAVSTDAAADLGKAWVSAKLEGVTFPFPLVSDTGLELFRRYQCYDDFERTPLHGTFLIDGNGLIRWRDVGPQPFMDVKFLMGESRRLLGGSGAGAARG